MDLVTLEDHLAKITATVRPPQPVAVGITESLGLICAENIVADQPVPNFDMAILDGYAVRSIDLRGLANQTEEKIVLPVVGDITAGANPPSRLQPKQTVFVESGATIPALADAILPERWVTRLDNEITVHRAVNSGDYLRRIGDDISSGESLISRGNIIGVNHIGLLADIGRQKILVHPKPRVAIMSIGNGLVDINQANHKGYSYDANTYALAAAAKLAGAEVNRIGVLSSNNNFAELSNQLRSAADKSEIIIIAGAVGGRTASNFQSSLNSLGKISVERVAMYPGSLQGFGTLGSAQVPTFLLPSDLITNSIIFDIFIRPTIKLALGKNAGFRRTVKAKALSEFMASEDKVGFIPAILLRDENTGEYFTQGVNSALTSGTRNLAAFAKANCLAIVPTGISKIAKEQTIEVSFLGETG